MMVAVLTGSVSTVILCLATFLSSVTSAQTTGEYVNICNKWDDERGNEGGDELQHNTTLVFQYQLPDGKHMVQWAEGIDHANAKNSEAFGVLVEPIYNRLGCFPYDYDTLPNTSWIGLVERGDCRFSTKVEVAFGLGASGLIVYQFYGSDAHVMTGISGNYSATMIKNDLGMKYSILMENGTKVNVTIGRKTRLRYETSEPEQTTNAILLVMTSLMSPTAIVMNILALVALVYYPEKPKPHLYLIINLIVTDLLVAVIGTAMILLMYPSFTDDKPKTEYTIIYRSCAGVLLQEFWDLSLYSNLMTLLSLTFEHFIAFRWPLKHKLFVTKQRVMVIIGLCWTVSAIPMAVGLLEDTFNADVEQCYRDQSFCHALYYIHFEQNTHTNTTTNTNTDTSWHYSLALVLIVSAVFAVMVFVYGYIISVINRVCIRNPGFRKKRSAVITTLFLVTSFIMSYIFYFITHIYVVAERNAETPLLAEGRKLFKRICPACELMLDFLFTGMIGAILDPIIYCARMREIKQALSKLCRPKLFSRRPSVSSTGYVRAIQHSTNSTITEEHV